MAKKIMTCKAAPEIELQFDGGDSILLRFDIKCLTNIQELEGGLQEFVKKNVTEMAVALVYAAGKDNNNNFDEQKACGIIANMSIENITEIINTFQESIGMTDENNEEIKKYVAQLLGIK